MKQTIKGLHISYAGKFKQFEYYLPTTCNSELEALLCHAKILELMSNEACITKLLFDNTFRSRT